MKPTKQQNEHLYGPSAHSDYAPGDTVRYVDGDELCEGEVLFTRATGPVYEGGPVLKAGHVVDTGRGWPKYVKLKDALQPD